MKLVLAAVVAVALATVAVPSAGHAHPGRASASAPATDACGVEPLKPDGTPWHCTFDDEFSTSTLDRARWLPQTTFVTGTGPAHACYLDDPSTVSVAGGSLNLVVRRTARWATCGSLAPTPYVAGMVTTYHLFSQQYGRFEARIRDTWTDQPGLHEAFWLWPDDRFSAPVWSLFRGTGEIDVSETYSVHPDLSIPYLHYNATLLGGPVPGVNTAWDCTAHRGVWNTYTLEWTPSRLTILVNGRTCLVNTSGDAAFLQPHIIALTAAIGGFGNAYDGRAVLPATMNVDYVRVWD